MKEFFFNTIQEFNDYIGVETLHPLGASDKPCGVGRADANPKLLLNDT